MVPVSCIGTQFRLKVLITSQYSHAHESMQEKKWQKKCLRCFVWCYMHCVLEQSWHALWTQSRCPHSTCGYALERSEWTILLTSSVNKLMPNYRSEGMWEDACTRKRAKTLLIHCTGSDNMSLEPKLGDIGSLLHGSKATCIEDKCRYRAGESRIHTGHKRISQRGSPGSACVPVCHSQW